MGNDSFDEIFDIERKLRTGRLEVQLAALSSVLACMNTATPLAISTLYLRLVDFLIQSQNETRIIVIQTLRECRQWSRHSATHAEEIVRRLGMVWDSNDGLARALVLRAFGYLAGGVVNVPGAIYRIQQSLISTSESEYEAALQAALEMSVSSPSFVVPVLAESILYLYKNVSSFSFLRPKILQILSLRTNSWRVERMIFYSLLNIREDFFLREYLETMMQIVLRSQSLQQPYLDLLGRVPNSEAFRKRMMEVLESIC